MCETLFIKQRQGDRDIRANMNKQVDSKTDTQRARKEESDESNKKSTFKIVRRQYTRTMLKENTKTQHK